MKLLNENNPFFKIYISFILFALVLFMGIAGYMAICSYNLLDAFYMTIITIGSVGYQEVKTLDDAGKIFTSFLILSNIAIFTYFITVVSRFFLDGEFIHVYKSIRMKKTIHDLRNHTIICGFGRNGFEAAKIFDKNHVDYVVIERHLKMPPESKIQMHYFLEADATHDEVLLEAGIKNAKALITTLPDDANNVFVVLTARELNPGLKIISRASNDTSVQKLKRAGADNIIMPDKIGGAHMATLVLSPDIKEFVDVLSTTMSNDFQIIEILIGKSLAIKEIDAWYKTGATILGVKSLSGNYTLNPPPEQQLTPGERIISMGSVSQIIKLKELLQ